MDDFSDISIEYLYLAYRKAKADAYYESTHFHALAYVAYEKNLDRNIRALHDRLTSSNPSWSVDKGFASGHVYAPKGVSTPEQSGEDRLFYRFLDPIEEWNRVSQKTRAEAEFRLLIVPKVDFQIVSALWIIAVGHRYDSILDPSVCYGNRVRRYTTRKRGELGEINLDCVGLFPPYFSGYGRWPENALPPMPKPLEPDHP